MGLLRLLPPSAYGKRSGTGAVLSSAADQNPGTRSWQPEPQAGDQPTLALYAQEGGDLLGSDADRGLGDGGGVLYMQGMDPNTNTRLSQIYQRHPLLLPSVPRPTQFISHVYIHTRQNPSLYPSRASSAPHSLRDGETGENRGREMGEESWGREVGGERLGRRQNGENTGGELGET
ncbi:unnamed protein product [Boreogadus saida]